MPENQTREELEDMDEEQLKAIAASRGITVTASDGSSSPSVDDYVEALAPPTSTQGGGIANEEARRGDDDEDLKDDRVIEGDRRAAAAQRSSQRPKDRIDETIPGGMYKNSAGKLVNAHGQEVDDKGRVLKPEERQYPDSPE